MSDQNPVIVWFRQDLRVGDNPALAAAASTERPILPVYILDDEAAGEWRLGAASRWWLHQSLDALNESLRGKLCFLNGRAIDSLPKLAQAVGAAHVVWNRCYEPWRIERDAQISEALSADGIRAESFNGSLLFEPHCVSKADGTPYKVFTPFYRKGCLKGASAPGEPVAAPERIPLLPHGQGLALDELQLMPATRWYTEMADVWEPGESGAHSRLQRFLDDGIRDYKAGRNRPDRQQVSRLSPHLHFGEVSPRQVWHAARRIATLQRLESDVDHFLSELGWREFSYYLLYHQPELPRVNLQAKFDRFPWREDPDALQRWQYGLTGYPIVDAGMRELWRTGYMHNRVRMIVGSFLVKNLLLHWHHGADWFWDTLVDADLANNSASWQWIAGCGADAAPYFRIFNPVIQGQKFDPEGAYVRRYLPELAGLPVKFLHSPWTAPDDVLTAANVTLGEHYPKPIVDLKTSRERALDAFRSLKSQF